MHRTPLSPRDIPGTHFCKRPGKFQGHSAGGKIKTKKISMTPSGIASAISRLAPQCLASTKCATAYRNEIQTRLIKSKQILITRRTILEIINIKGKRRKITYASNLYLKYSPRLPQKIYISNKRIPQQWRSPNHRKIEAPVTVNKRKWLRKTGSTTNTMLTTFITYKNKGEIQTPREIKGFRELWI